ncbi:MAG: 23S rRNA (adenine(2503)-C(2))-methyltransferase RlmN [Candidatus Krumholzibacteriia bacterium]
MTGPRPLIRDVPAGELAPLLRRLGQPAYRAQQVAHWLHRAQALDWESLSDLPRDLRARLAELYDLQGLFPGDRLEAADGTRKFLFRLRDGASVESVIIPMESHLTFCLSSQVGCAMACRFCATARGGLARNLTAAEIQEQAVHLARDLAARPPAGFGARGFNLVFMGMGEPLDNWAQVVAALDIFTSPDGWGLSPRRVTISTSGHREGLLQLLRLPQAVGLTLSVNAASPALRQRLMPVSARTPLPQLLELAEKYARRIQRKVTLGYVLIGGVNDNPTEARALAALAARRPFKVNLIPLNRLDDERLSPPGTERVLAFQRVLLDAGLQAYIRTSGGQEIAAACGQLRQRRQAPAPSVAGSVPAAGSPGESE